MMTVFMLTSCDDCLQKSQFKEGMTSDGYPVQKPAGQQLKMR